MSVLAAYERLVIEFGTISPDDTFKFIREGMKIRLAFSKLDPDTPFIKLVDEESGEIAGYAIWGFSKDVNHHSEATGNCFRVNTGI